MFKKFKVCDYFLEIACYCLSIDANFGQSRKMCLIHFRSDDAFFIKNNSQFNRKPFRMSFVSCCKDFFDFQIDLRSIDCRNSWVKVILHQTECKRNVAATLLLNMGKSFVYKHSPEMSIPLKSRNHFNFSAPNKCRFVFKPIIFEYFFKESESL